MKGIKVIKAASKFVVSVGVGAIVSNAIAFTTPIAGVAVLTKAAISVGSFVLSGMVSDKACEYIDEKIDEGVEEAEKMAKKILTEKEPQTDEG